MLKARSLYDSDHEMFRDSVRKFIDKEITPNTDKWEEQGKVDRAFWNKAGDAGLLCPTVPEEFGGPGLDFRFNAVVAEEIAYAGSTVGVTLHSDICVDYLVDYGSREQQMKWLPKVVSGEAVMAIAMTEPGTGSDLQGIRTTAKKDGNHYVINGQKTYITNGQHADLIIVVAKTEPDKGARGTSLILVEADREGFARGRNLDKVGQHTADTSELFFDNVRVPMTNCLGNENEGFAYLMNQLPQERLSIAVSAQANAQKAFDITLEFVRDRKAFGQSVLDFQNTRFVMADLKTKLQVGWAHLDHCIAKHLKGDLDAYEGASSKLWHTELQWEMVDTCLQLHGGAGYMNEYEIARLWRDARVQRIYGGTSEIMKELIGRSL